VQQVLFGFFHVVEAVEAFANDHVARGAGAAHVTGVLDRDAVVEQGLADGRARWGRDGSALRTVLGVGQDLDRGHGCCQISSIFRPARACWMPRFMRLAAKASVPLASASVAASTSLAVPSLATCASPCIRASIASRSAADSRSPSAASALRVAT